MAEQINPKLKKILFCPSSFRSFRTSLIGHLNEVSQVYSTILLCPKPDEETQKILNDKNFFPRLEKIINWGEGLEKKNLWFQNRFFYQLARRTLKLYQPDLVIAINDSAFANMYLLRLAKQIQIPTIIIQTNNASDDKLRIKLIDLENAYLRFPSFLPFWLRLILAKSRRYFSHFLYYWLLPISIGQKPFLGKSAYISIKSGGGLKDVDYQVVFSKRDFAIYQKNGAPLAKLHILSHPLVCRNREFFEKAYLNQFKKEKKYSPAVVLMLDTFIGFRRQDKSLILKEERQKDWQEIIKLIKNSLPGWQIYIKPHPDTPNISELKEKLETIDKNISVVDPLEPAEKYIEISDVVIGLPLAASTTLFTASLQCPEKPILALDFYQEIFGDYYKDFEGVEYVENRKTLVEILNLIRNGQYRKKEKNNAGEDEFSNTIELLEYFFNKQVPRERDEAV